MTTTYTVLLVGDQGVGNSGCVRRILESEYTHPNHSLASPVSFVKIFPTNFGHSRILFQEIADHESVTSSPIAMQADGAFIVFDVNARNPFENVLKRYYDIVRVCGEIPVVLCGNKADGNDRSVSGLQVRLDRNVVLPYFEISNGELSENGRYEPFLWLVRKLAGPALGVEPIEIIQFVYTQVDPPPREYYERIKRMTPEFLAQLEAENAAAPFAAPLPDEDDDL